MKKREKALEVARKLENAGITIHDIVELLRETATEDISKFIDKSTDKKICELLIQLGISVKNRGFEYWKEAIKYCYQTENIRPRMTNEIYPVVAQKCLTTSKAAERTMRHTIESSWEKGNLDLKNKIFAYTVSNFKDNPTNSEFLSAITNYLILENLK